MHEPPVMFNLKDDLGESNPLDLSSPAVADALAEIRAALATHLATVLPVPNQMIGSGPHRGGSCDPMIVTHHNISAQ